MFVINSFCRNSNHFEDEAICFYEKVEHVATRSLKLRDMIGVLPIGYGSQQKVFKCP